MIQHSANLIPSFLLKGAFMGIRVVYHDHYVDEVPFYILHLGIECKRIKMFYRESERRWIVVGVDPVRQFGPKIFYNGPERRRLNMLQPQFTC
jgi:hypothetical protein